MQGLDPIAQIFLVSTLIMVSLVGFIIFFVVVYQRRLLRQQRRMREQEAAHQRELLSASIQTQEKERQRIARDLHDEIGAMLSTVKMKVSQAKRRAKGDESLSPVLVETTDLLTDSIKNVRRISHALLPPVLDKFGLHAALKDLVEKATTEEGSRVRLQVEGEPVRFPQHQELGLFRVSQEVLNNALKHAQAKLIEFRLVYQPEQLSLEIRDDGVGFDWEKKQAESSGLGLKNIESRVLTIGGKWEAESKIGKGTRVRIEVGIGEE